MKKNDLTEKLKNIHIELDKLNDESPAVTLLVNFSETVVEEYRKVSDENHDLKNIISKITGEQSTPA